MIHLPQWLVILAQIWATVSILAVFSKILKNRVSSAAADFLLNLAFGALVVVALARLWGLA